MVKEKILFSFIVLTFIIAGCVNGGATGGATVTSCPQYQCVKISVPAQSTSEPLELSGKGPTLFSGTVHPKVLVKNPNDEPANFRVTFSCKNLFTGATETLETPETWLQPGGERIIQGNFKVGAKENWECSYDIFTSMINGCQLQQV